MTFNTMQNSFIAGELSPSVTAHTDLAQYKNSASVARNFLIDYRGGALSRPGFAYVGTSLTSGNGLPPRLIPFQFNLQQQYGLEFGEQTVTRTVSGVANNGSGLCRVTLSSTRGIFSGNNITISGIVGATEANGTWAATVVDSTHIDLVGSTYSSAYVSGGTATGNFGYMRVIYQGAYAVEASKNISTISHASPAVITITGHGYSVGDWIFIQGTSSESPSLNGLAWVITAVTTNTVTLADMFGNPYNTTVAGTGGTVERIYTLEAPYAVADIYWLKFTQSADTISLTCVNQETHTEYPTYDLVRNGATNWVFNKVTFQETISPPSGISATATNSTTKTTYYSYCVTSIDADTGSESIASSIVTVQNNDISIYAGSNQITWQPVNGASSYNVYATTPVYNATTPQGVPYGYIGSTTGLSFVDKNIVADFTKTPPTHQNPFARNSIASINITAGGSGYASTSTSISVTSSTGSGFIGYPIISGGAISSVVVQSGGENYSASDTVVFSGGSFATGNIIFTVNPAASQTITLNSVTWTFVASSPTGQQSVIGADIPTTIANLVAYLNADATAGLTVASYSGTSNGLYITYKTTGTAGNAYTLASGITGVTPSGATLTGGSSVGSGATATITLGSGVGTYPSDVAYYQQRRVYANSTNEPNTYWMSRPGDYTNMDTSIPTVDNDAIIGTPWSQQINGIQAMIPMIGGLMTMTGSGAWNVTASNGAGITPSNQLAQAQAYNGCHNNVPPLVINYDILYVQSKGSIIRDLSYNFFTNVWTGLDKTVYSSHLFNYHEIQGWAYSEEPYKVVWIVRDDGIMLSFTYLKEQNIAAFARHDTDGFFVNCISIAELPVDAVYAIVKRYINSQWKYYIERMDNRNWTNSENCFCVDAGESLPLTYPNATLTPAAANGTSNITSVGITNGGTGYTSPTITAIDPTSNSTATGASFTAVLTGGVITSITVNNAGSGYTPGATYLQITDSTGTGAVLYPIITNNVTFTASSGVFNSGMVGDVIRIGNNNESFQSTPNGQTINGYCKAVITSYISSTQVVANILVPNTATIYDDPNNTPVPAVSGQWSIGTPTTTISGLNHLEGETVVAVGDGGDMGTFTVSGGQITLPQAVSTCVVGLPYTCQLQTMYLDVQEQSGGVQGKRKTIPAASLRVVNTRGISIGVNQPIQSQTPNNANIPWNTVEVKELSALTPLGLPLDLYTGDYYVTLPQSDAKNSVYGMVAIEQSNPFPCSINGLSVFYTIGDTGG